jgi:1-piperideine-2-carboxylate/1-pyrroline-2-carboxylate reductase [NAD(P)H]
MLKVLDAVATQKALPFPMLVEAILHASLELRDGALIAPERMNLDLGQGARLLCMPAVGRDIGVTKLVTVHPDNYLRNLPTINGELLVFDIESGHRRLILDGPTVTARRTAAVTLAGINFLAHTKPKSALLIGTGVQSRMHAEALIDYFNIRQITVAGLDDNQGKAFATSLSAVFPQVEFTPAAVMDVGRHAQTVDVIIALTTALEPVVPVEIPDNTLVVGVGAFRPDMAEIPADLINRRRVVVDFLHGAKAEAGDLLRAGVHWDSVVELADLIGSPDSHRSQASIFKTVGHASWDLAAARVAVHHITREE